MSSADFIQLKNFNLLLGIGIDSRELGVKQHLLISIKAGLEPQKPYFTDDLRNTKFDYSDLPKRLRKFVENRHFGLIEKLAEDFAAIGIVEFGLPWIDITVDKQGILKDIESVSVTIHRNRSQHYKLPAFYLLLGSNKKSAYSFHRALELIRDRHTLLKEGNIFETSPFGAEYEHQENYQNQAIKIAAPIDGQTLKESLLEIEAIISEECEIPIKTKAFRLIDIDILFCGNVVQSFQYEKSPGVLAEVSIPSREASDPNEKHIFLCMADLEPNYVHPSLNKSMAELSK